MFLKIREEKIHLQHLLKKSAYRQTYEVQTVLLSSQLYLPLISSLPRQPTPTVSPVRPVHRVSWAKTQGEEIYQGTVSPQAPWSSENSTYGLKSTAHV